MRTVLGIEVDDALVEHWVEWFAPAQQPFDVRVLSPQADGTHIGTAATLSPEVRDTFFVYEPGFSTLTEHEFAALSPGQRRALVAARPRGLRPVTWPTDPLELRQRRALAYVEHGVAPSRHREVSDATWGRAAEHLPEAERLTGTFADGSGPNCFGAVMAAAGVPSAETVWMLREPFEAWLRTACSPTRGTSADDAPGTVLVWRDRAGLAQHAAITIGDGWALNKPSQAWCSPYLVWTVRETIAHNRVSGQRLERHRLHP